MDEFFQKLREIQKKERNLSGLAPVGENFYQNISRYLNILRKKIDDNPFSFESYLLRDAQRITAEICERREHKISNSAVMSVQRTYQLFKESELDTPNTPKIPRNSTPEEEKLFHALVDSLKIYREKMRGPLRFQNLQAKDRNLNIPDHEKENLRKSNAAGDKDGVDISGIEPSPPDIGVDKPNKDNDIRFTPEEEAAIVDDIYKQFGNEPFPGEKLGGSDSSPNEGKTHSKDKKPSSKKGKLPSEDDKLSSKETKPSPEDKNHSNSVNIETAQTKEQDNQSIKTNILIVLEELPSIMGVDKQVYGPLHPQDIVTIPEPNAKILIKNQKGKSIQKL
ncbi:MAG TPA: hypothetical protein PLC38_06400 [Methanobacterium sp.]|nr:MAG: DNA replication complex GINS family protein [Methanobacterium sp.]HOI71899.1 hypothetical protein [Methanobacterium sp.]